MSTAPPTAPVRGRGDAKRLAVIEAAARAFLTQGYEAASMDAIAADAVVSKRTVYNHFPGKRDLFRAVVARLYEGMNDGETRRLSADQPPAAALPVFARDLLAHLRRPEVSGLMRLVIAEHQRFPELAQDYYEGKGPVAGLLESYIAAQHARGVLDAPNPGLVASLFLGGIKEALYWPGLMGLPLRHDEEAVIATAVAALLRAYGRADGTSPSIAAQS
jgi:TetR/AcrR family transcriptional regulator of autoinduction and epiphytic fitness